MALQGLFTNEGLAKSIEAENNEGFRIRPISFSVSEVAGVLDANRDLASINPTWYQGPVSSVVKIDDNTIQINCNIPAGSDTVPRFTKEVYLYALDFNTSVEYLLAFSQPSSELTYDPDGELRLRLQLKIANIDLANLYEFNYTQATEISDHNNDLNAHPLIQSAMNKAGIYMQSGVNKFNGQNYDGFPAKSPSVLHLNAVYFDTINNRYDRAIAILGDDRRFAIGFYDSINDVVVYSGVIDYPHTVSPFTPVYLSDTLLGGSGTSPTDVVLGYTLPNNKMLVGATIQQTSDSQDFDGDLTINLRPPVVRELTIQDTDGVKWDVKITNEGLLYTVPYSVRDADALFRIPKIDLSSAQLIVKTNGELKVEAPPSTPGLISDEFYYLEAPNGISWKLTVNIANYIVTQSYLNAFLVRSENVGHFAVKQTDQDHAMVYIQVYDSTSLPVTPPVSPEITGMLPNCMYNNGTVKRPIFWDGGNWRYYADNTIV